MKRIRILILAIMSLLVAGQSVYGQDDIIFRRHIIKSGYHGLLYGIAADLVFEIDGAAAAGIPVITAGASVLVPLLTNADKSIDFDAMILNGHGKSIGWAHGFAASALIFGEDLFTEDNYKLTVGLGALTSIGGGLLGKGLAKNNLWSEGRVELYRHYGWLLPFAGFSVVSATTEDIRLSAAATLLSGAGGYFLAGKISDWNDFTRGEVRATQTLAGLNLGLGYGIMLDVIGDNEEPAPENAIYPALGALVGTAAGHLYNRNLGFTPQQGMLTAYAAAGGAVIGLGVALMTESEKITPYYLIPYVAGLGSYITAVELLKRKSPASAMMDQSGKGDFHVSFMPQNMLINNKIESRGFLINGRYVGMQPLFAASFTF